MQCNFLWCIVNDKTCCNMWYILVRAPDNIAFSLECCRLSSLGETRWAVRGRWAILSYPNCKCDNTLLRQETARCMCQYNTRHPQMSQSFHLKSPVKQTKPRISSYFRDSGKICYYCCTRWGRSLIGFRSVVHAGKYLLLLYKSKQGISLAIQHSSCFTNSKFTVII